MSYQKPLPEKLKDATAHLFVYAMVGGVASLGGCLGYELTERKAQLRAYTDCLQNAGRRRDIAEVSMLCDKIKERL